MRKPKRKKITPADLPLELAEPTPAEEVGYARVSTPDQDPDFQIQLLKKRGIIDDSIFVDVASGTKQSRQGLRDALLLMTGRPGWTLVVWKLDRLGRDVKGLIAIAERFREQDWNLVSLTEQLDTRTPFGKFYFHTLASLAQLERDMTVERTKAGMANMRAKGFQLGRRTRIKPAQFREIERLLLQDKLTIVQIGERFKIAPATVNHHFPGWKGKTRDERRAYRKAHPLPKPSTT